LKLSKEKPQWWANKFRGLEKNDVNDDQESKRSWGGNYFVGKTQRSKGEVRQSLMSNPKL